MTIQRLRYTPIVKAAVAGCVAGLFLVYCWATLFAPQRVTERQLSWIEDSTIGKFLQHNHSIASEVRVPSKENATAAVIFLHGLGGRGENMSTKFNLANFLSMKDVRFVFPNAETNPVSLMNGKIMPSWFDIKSLDQNEKEDEVGIIFASMMLNELINKEIADGIPAERIIIGGFSQGGAVALHTAVCIRHAKISGVVALSTWLPLFDKSRYLASQQYNDNVPMFQAHGDADRVVPYTWGEASYNVTKAFNPLATFKSYSNLDHTVSSEVMNDVITFIKRVLNKP